MFKFSPAFVILFLFLYFSPVLSFPFFILLHSSPFLFKIILLQSSSFHFYLIFLHSFSFYVFLMFIYSFSLYFFRIFLHSFCFYFYFMFIYSFSLYYPRFNRCSNWIRARTSRRRMFRGHTTCQQIFYTFSQRSTTCKIFLPLFSRDTYANGSVTWL